MHWFKLGQSVMADHWGSDAEQDVAQRQQDVSSVLVAFGYVAAVALVLPVLLVGRVDRELLMLEFGVTFVGLLQ